MSLFTEEMGGIPSREIKSLSELQPGDHIKYHRLEMTYAHHAIVVNVEASNYTIIHFNGGPKEGKPNSCIQKEVKCNFGEENFEVLDYPSDKRFTREETVVIAFFFLENQFGNYNLFTNNCEHFATSCATGYPCSIQTLRVALAALGPTVGLANLISYCNTKKVVSIKKVNGKYVVTVIKD